MARTVYIAGPITGVDQYWEPFERAEDELSAAGFIPLSPAHLPEGMTPRQYMKICLAMVDAADAVLFLPGFTGSAGATIEYKLCLYTMRIAATSVAELKEAFEWQN